MSEPQSTLFLPGASGETRFWEPVAAALGRTISPKFAGYPGFGDVPTRPDVRNFADLVRRVGDAIDAPVNVVAQSMGGVLALQAALLRPNHLKRLVLSATSGGLDTRALGAVDWRPVFAQHFPHAPTWFADARVDLEARLPELTLPVLLVWGDTDPISPVAVGERLAQLLPNAELVTIAGGDHDVARTHADVVAAHIRRFFAGGDPVTRLRSPPEPG